jgi:AcrR family transcriptional regulator
MTNMKSGGETATRGYRQSARADAAAQTATDILDATYELYWQTPIEDLTLALVAEHAGVSVQTVIRRFGSKDQLIAALTDRERERVVASREVTDPGDLHTTVKLLLGHYEHDHIATLKLLAEESRSPAIARVTEEGRRLHREWCETVFAELLADLPVAERRIRHAQLVAICDIYTWKVLRQDMDLSVKQTERTLVEMIEALTKGK